MPIRHSNVNQQMTAIRSGRDLIDKQLESEIFHAGIRERQIKRPLHLPAELLGFPERLPFA